MANLRTWSTTAASNNQATPDGWPEGQAPSTVNDCGREMMAAVRSWYEDAAWVDFGHTPTYVSTTQFSVSGDKTATYAVGRRVRVVGASTGYGTISASSYGAPNTTVTVTWDSGNTPTSPTTVSLGILTSNSGYALSANAALLNAANVFTASQTVSTTSTSAIGINSTNADGGQLYIQRSSSTKVNLGTEKAVLGSGSVDDALLYGTTGLKLQSGGTITIGGVAASDFARLSQSNTFTASQTIAVAQARLALNDTASGGSASIQFQDNGTPKGYIGANTAANGLGTGSDGDIVIRAESTGFVITVDSGVTKHLRMDNAGAITTPNASASEVGFKGIPPSSKSGSYTAVLADAGTLLYQNTAATTFTIPANGSVAYPVGTTLTFINAGTGGNISIAITTDTLRLAATATTGTRTLADWGVATAVKLASTTWVISGAGLS